MWSCRTSASSKRLRIKSEQQAPTLEHTGLSVRLQKPSEAPNRAMQVPQQIQSCRGTANYWAVRNAAIQLLTILWRPESGQHCIHLQLPSRNHLNDYLGLLHSAHGNHWTSPRHNWQFAHLLNTVEVSKYDFTCYHRVKKPCEESNKRNNTRE